MSKSKARFLAELLNASGRVKKDKSQLTGGDSTIDLDALPTITNAKLQNSSITVAGNSVSLGGSTSIDTSEIDEHSSYLYFTAVRAQQAIDGQPLDITNLDIGGVATINSSGEWVGPSTGLKGEPGSKGQKGEIGSTGAAGAKGNTGATGPQGTRRTWFC